MSPMDLIINGASEGEILYGLNLLEGAKMVDSVRARNM